MLRGRFGHASKRPYIQGRLFIRESFGHSEKSSKIFGNHINGIST